MRPGFALTWRIQWIGSFPVAGTDPESVSSRLDRFIPSEPPLLVQLSISVSGVKVCAIGDEHPLLCHTIRRVNCVIGRADRRQVAYIAREPSGHIYRRLCHLFRTESGHQVEEIESVLGNAFQAAALARPLAPVQQKHEPAVCSVTPVQQQQQQVPRLHRRAQSRTVATNTSVERDFDTDSTPCSVSSTTGTGSSAANTVGAKTPVAHSTTRVHSASALFLNRLFRGKFRDPSPDAGNKENPSSAKRRRRPVSAVFSKALHRISTASIYPKRYPSADPPRKECTLTVIQQPTVSAAPVHAQSERRLHRLSAKPDLASSQRQLYEQTTTTTTTTATPLRPLRHTQTTPSLNYDERLGEWIYPVDETLEKQLDQVAYFCKNAARHRIVKVLLEQPDGAFLIRFSESKRRCLALSVRVPFVHNPTGISHYLIIRNDSGFKLRGSSKFFPSIAMLVTHHSVMPEQLPCRLIFVNWGAIWKNEANNNNNNNNNNYDYPPNDEIK